MNKHLLKLLFGSFVYGIVLSGCSHTAYVHQNQQTFHDYKAMKHDKIVNKTRKPKIKRKH